MIKKAVLFLPVGFFFFALYSFLKSTVPEMPFIPASVEHILLLIIVIAYFFEEMQSVVVEPIYQKAIFWISVAFIINSAGNFFLFLFSKSNIDNEVFLKQYTIIYTTVTVLKNLLLCVSIFINDKPSNETDKVVFDVDLD